MKNKKLTPQDNFSGFSLKKEIIKSIKELGFDSPTPIQQRVIPFLNSSVQDLIASGENTSGSRFVHVHSYYTPTYTRNSSSPVSTTDSVLPSTASSTTTTTSSGTTYTSAMTTSTTSTPSTSSGGSSSGGGGGGY